MEAKLRTFLVMKCYPLNDPYECDADRHPLCIIHEPKIPDCYKKEGYEIYEILPSGSLTIRQNWDDYD